MKKIVGGPFPQQSEEGMWLGFSEGTPEKKSSSVALSRQERKEFENSSSDQDKGACFSRNDSL